MFIGHFKAGTFRFHFERADVSFREFGDEERVIIFRVQGGARVVGETCRAIGIILVGGGDVGGLEGSAGFPDALGHPRVVCGAAVLVVISPAGIGTFGDVEEAFAFAFEVGIVVDGKHVSVFIESDFLRVAQATCEDFESRAIWVATQHGAFVRSKEIFAFFGSDVGSFVTNRPIDTAVGSEGEAVHVVAGVGDVDSESMSERLTLIGFAIAGGVAEFPHVWSDGCVNVAAPCQDACRDAGDFGIKISSEDG